MKKILTVFALMAAVGTAQAQHLHGHPHYHTQVGGWHWVVPAIIGGAIVYGATRPAQAEPAPVIIQSAPQPGQIIQCPPGTMPFEQRGWVRNQYNQYLQTTYIECK